MFGHREKASPPKSPHSPNHEKKNAIFDFHSIRPAKLLDHLGHHPKETKKTTEIDEIYTRAAMSMVEETKAQGDQPYNGGVPPPPGFLPLYLVLVNRIEREDNSDRLVPFVLRRLHENGHEQEFLDYMQARAQFLTDRIDKECEKKGSLFVETLGAFINVHDQLNQLNDKVLDMTERSAFRRGKQAIVAAGNKVIELDRILINVTSVLREITLILDALKHYEQAEKSALEGDPVKALRSLHRVCETRMSPKLKYSQWLFESALKMKRRIIAFTIQGLMKSLEDLNTYNFQMGYATLKNVCKIRRITLEPFVFEPASLEDIIQRFGDQQFAFLRDKFGFETKLHFRPLLHYRHVLHFLLDNPDDMAIEYVFEYYITYMDSRQSQVIMRLQEPRHLKTVQDIVCYLCEVVGMFSADLVISQRVPGISTEQFYNLMWNTTVQVVSETMRDGLSAISGQQDFDKIRDLVRLFIDTLLFLRLDVTVPRQILRAVINHQRQDLVETLADKVAKSLTEDSFVPLVITNAAHYKTALTGFDAWTNHLDKGPSPKYPRQMPFSKSVPEIYVHLKEFILASFKVSRDILLTDDQSIDHIMTTLPDAIKVSVGQQTVDVLDQSDLVPAQYVQLNLNFAVLQEVHPYLVQTVYQAFPHVNVTGLRLCCDSVFEDVRCEAETQLLEDLSIRIGELIQANGFDIPRKSDRPSAAAQKLIEYVITFVEVTATLSAEFKGRAWNLFCDEISTNLVDLILYETELLTVEGLSQLQTDLDYYETNLRSLLDAATPADRIPNSFILLRQLAALFILDEWELYFEHYGLPDSKYALITPEMCAMVMSRIKPTESTRRSIFNVKDKKTEQEKLEREEVIVTKLQGLMHDKEEKERAVAEAQATNEFDNVLSEDDKLAMERLENFV